ncbi:MAG: hypothetical protein KGH98_00855 [Candidatus Micrarchaeota archaeon]|nr:hypothetical protein [Candidatus Micrarchaeota archaeon]
MLQSKLAKALPAAFVMVSLLMPVIYAAGPVQTPSIDTTSWIPLATAIVLLVIAIASIVYMLSGITGSGAARNWSRTQIYEGLLSVLLLVAFGSVAYITMLSPQPGFSKVGLIPPQCASAGSLNTLAVCDLSNFNSGAYTSFALVYITSIVTGLTPGIWFNVYLPVGKSAPSTASQVGSKSPLAGFGPPPGDSILNVSFGLASLYPQSMEQVTSISYSAIITLTMLSQVQLLILSSSVFLFALFIILGLLARTFGLTRSFGGTLIALGLGLGIIYPLLVSITYGFIDSNITTITLIPQNALSIVQFGTQAGFTILLNTAGCLLQSEVVAPITQSAAQCSLINFVDPNLLTSLLFIAAGFTFIPFINFIILDAFIVDFSRAFGERIDFMSLLTSVI